MALPAAARLGTMASAGKRAANVTDMAALTTTDADADAAALAASIAEDVLDEGDGDDLHEELGPGPRRSVMRSSLDLPFFILSEQELVEGVPALPRDQFQQLFAWLDGIIDALEEEKAVVLADFEGEMTGFGGELVTAAFMPTTLINRMDLSVTLRRGGYSMLCQQLRAGLLLDLRCEGGRYLCRRLMESEPIVKVIWGADGDLTSLRHQVFPAPLETASRSVIDAQLAFSPPHARLGMARMLERVPANFRAALPAKASVEFDQPHSWNRRALRWPLREFEARYAADDLHRLEAILATQEPPNGGYGSAFVLTGEIMARVENDPYGLAWLGNELGFFSRKPPGVQRRAKAVQLVRHLKTLPARMANNGFFPPWILPLEASLAHELAMEGVFIPADASFADDEPTGPLLEGPLLAH